MGGRRTSSDDAPKTLSFVVLEDGGSRHAAPDDAPRNPIEAADEWSRWIWRTRRVSPWILVAAPLWLAIRIGYRLSLLGSQVFYVVARSAAWLYWRLYELCGPAARLGKAIYWRALYPALEAAARLGRAGYWTLYRLFGPAARVLKRAYWRFAFPIIESCGRALRALYWAAIFPLLEAVANLFGFRLTAPRTSLPAAPRQASIRDAFAAGLRENDAIVLVAGGMADFDPLFDCAPRFRLAGPTNAALHILFTAAIHGTSRRQLELLGLRLRNGSPCRRLHLYAVDAETSAFASDALSADVHCLPGLTAAEFEQAVRARSLEQAPSLTIDRFGPVALLVSALWGRVGSTTIFDAQTSFLLEQGAFVVRVFVDHYPAPGAEGRAREIGLVSENLTETRPNLALVARRPRSSARLRRSKEYVASSAVRRVELELRDSVVNDPTVLEWASARCEAVVVNHGMHMAFAERISGGAPIILETHDVLTLQLDAHGWPDYVSLKGEPEHLRDADQQAIWRRAAACVNLSPEDHAVIAGHANTAAMVRPHAATSSLRLRPWPEVVAANGLSQAFAASEQFDILLWGDWHQSNVRAVSWFLENVAAPFEELRRARIAVVGRVTRLLPDATRHCPNVLLAGFVDSLDDFFGRARVLVVPDQDGSGASIKMVDALRFSRAFASTRIGLRGLQTSGLAVPAHESAEDLARDLIRLLRDDDALRRREAIASRLFAENFSSETYRREWRALIETVAPSFGARIFPESAAPTPAAHGPADVLRFVAPADAPSAAAAPAPRPVARRAQERTHVLGAVICTYDRYDVLPGAIASLLAQDVSSADLEIVIVDNSPDQEKARAYARHYAGTRVRYLLEPIPGLSNARNVGAEACASKFVAYIDDDAVAAPDWAREMVAGFNRFAGRAGVAGGRIVPRWQSARPDWLPDELLGNLSLVDWGGEPREIRKNEWLAGCNIAFERDVLLDLGGFSRALGRTGAGAALMSNEESAVIEKFVEAGLSAIYVPSASVEHIIDPARLSQQWFRRRAAWQAVSDYVKDPKATAAYASAAAERLRRELTAHELPPGFSRADAEREAFRRDVGLMYDVVVAMLAGGVEVDDAGKSSASVQDKLVAGVRREMQRNPQLRSAIRKLTNT